MPKWHWPQKQRDRGQPGICPSLGNVCDGQGWGSRHVTPSAMGSRGKQGEQQRRSEVTKQGRHFSVQPLCGRFLAV